MRTEEPLAFGVNFALFAKRDNLSRTRQLTPEAWEGLYMVKSRLSKAIVGVVMACSGFFAITVPSLAASLPSAPYIVHNGDSMYSVALRAGFGLRDLALVNDVTQNSYLFPGERLALPFLYKVQNGDQLVYLAKRYNTSTSSIMSLNHLVSTTVTAGRVLLIARGSLTASMVPSKPKVLGAALTQPTLGAPQAMVASAYDSSASSNGPWGAVDYFGNALRFGSVAVDPKVIALGSKLFISGYTDPYLPKNGFYARAVDVGGAIKGNRIDIYLPQTSLAMQFGLEHVTVRVVH